MWTNLAAKVGTQDWSGALQKIGNAVAPPPGDDDDYHDDQEYYEDDNDEEYEGEDDRPTFGFVGMLARALDKDHADYDEEEEEPEPPVRPKHCEVPTDGQASTMTPPSAPGSVTPGVSQPKPHTADFIKKEQAVNAQCVPTACTGVIPPLLGEQPPAPLSTGTETLTRTYTDLYAGNSQYMGASQHERGNTEFLKRPLESHDGSSSLLFPAVNNTSPTSYGHSSEIKKSSQTGVPVKEDKEQKLQTPPLPAVVQHATSADTPSSPSLTTESHAHSNSDAMLLQKAQARIIELQKLLAEESAKSNKLSENLMMEFQRKEARLMEASTEEHQHELEQAEHRHKTEIHALQIRMATEEKNFLENQQKLCQMIEESSTRAERANMELENITQHEHRSRRIAEEKVAQTMALLDERDGLITTLKQKIKTLESSMNERAEGVEEAEEEVEELQIENEELQDKIDQLQGECSKLQEKIATLEDETTKLGPLQMELTMVREERDRERAKNQSVVQSTITSHSVLESERDSAVAEVRDLKQLLAAALGDLDIARADRGRLLTANNNLQSALEAFQDERQAEINMVEEHRLEAEAGIKAAHAAAVEIMKQTHAEEIRRVQRVAEENTKKAIEQRDDIMVSFKKLQAENFQTRRSLDEAIHRLQTTQEDVIDRTLMKNILLDWCIMKDKEKRQQVLELMASVLHFTDEEKESVHLTHLDIDSVRSKVVGAIAAPLPPSKAILEQLPGENVSEKWISFLMAETDDDF